LLVGDFGGGGGASLFLRRRGDGLLEAALVALEAAYNLQPVREERELEGEKLRAPHLSGRQEEEAKRAKRGSPAPRRESHALGSAANTFWLKRSEGLLLRFQKKTENYLAFIHLACAQLIFSKLLVSG
jgi:putative transposase